MEQLAGDTLARQRFLLLLFGIFAGIALLPACGGIYGVLALTSVCPKWRSDGPRRECRAGYAPRTSSEPGNRPYR